MAITKIQSNAFPANLDLTNISVDLPDGVVVTADVADGIITSQKLGDNIEFSGSYIKVPVGTTAQRPGSATVGSIRYNTDFERLEQFTVDGWSAIDTPPTIESLSYAGNALAVDPAGGETVTLTGANFQQGFSVTVGGTTAPSTTYISATEVRFTTPAKAAGDYEVKLQNSNGLAATLTDGIAYNGLPAFTTPAGKIGDDLLPSTTIQTITIVAAEPDGGALAYSITSGALPSGLAIDSDGDITGTTPSPSGTTTYNFTVTATDDENQTNSRNFNLVVLRPVYSYQINNSLRIDREDEAYLERSLSSNGNTRTWTFSCWLKRGKISTGQQNIINSRTAFGSGDSTQLYFNSDDTLSFTINSSVMSTISLRGRYRDPSSFYHLVVAVDTTQSSASERIKIYLNGELQGFDTGSYPEQNAQSIWNNSGYPHYIGRLRSSSTNIFDGYMSDIFFIDGQSLDSTAFGEFYNGVWTPKEYTGSYGTNGFHLDFSNSADIGNDVSGNNNDWTPNNLTASDVVSDSPTNNFATLNPLDRNTGTLSDGNLRFLDDGSNGWANSRSTFSVTSGKWYWEMTVTQFNQVICASIAGHDMSLGQLPGQITEPGVTYYSTGGTYYRASHTGGWNGTATRGDGGNTSWGASYGANDIISIALDMDTNNGQVWFAKNGVWQSSGDPANGINPAVAGLLDYSSSWGPIAATYYANTECLFNFGQSSFAYTLPAGFLALNASNLPEPTFSPVSGESPQDYFNSVTWTGNGSSQNISVGFEPDFTWIKRRNGTNSHQLSDVVRGFNKYLFSELDIDEETRTNQITATNSNGFLLGSSGAVNASGGTYVGWNWKAGGTPVENTDGSITSQVSANTEAGFSIVSYTATSSQQTVGHGLSQTPQIVIQKDRDASQDWLVHLDIVDGSLDFLRLNQTNAATNSGLTPPTSSAFYSAISTAGRKAIAYCFHSVEGYSKFGSYTGNSSDDGPFVYTGFKPAFVMIKSSTRDGDRSWAMYDNKRDSYNPVSLDLAADLSNSEGTKSSSYRIDFLSTGFKLRSYSNWINMPNETFIYMAFAETPFKYSTAR